MNLTRIVTALAGTITLSEDNSSINVKLCINGGMEINFPINLYNMSSGCNLSDSIYGITINYQKKGRCDCDINKDKIVKMIPKGTPYGISQCNCITPGTLFISIDSPMQYIMNNFELLVDVTKSGMKLNWRKLAKCVPNSMYETNISTIMTGNTSNSVMEVEFKKEKAISFGILFDNYTEDNLLPGYHMMLFEGETPVPFLLSKNDPELFGKLISREIVDNDYVATFWDGEYAKTVEYITSKHTVCNSKNENCKEDEKCDNE